MQRGPDTWSRLILPHLEDASGRLYLGPKAPPRNESVGERRISEIDRKGIIEHAASSRGRHSPAVGVAVLVKPSGNVRAPLAEAARRNADPDTDGEASRLT